jgi:hypothetical protein
MTNSIKRESRGSLKENLIEEYLSDKVKLAW